MLYVSVLRMYRDRDQTETLGLSRSRSRSVSVSVSLSLGQSRSRSISFSVSLGLGSSVVSAEVSVSDKITFSANYARFWGCGYVCVCECGWVGGWMSFGEDAGVRNVCHISNSDLTILRRKIAWLMVIKTENYRHLSRDDRARDLGRDHRDRDRDWPRPRLAETETDRDRDRPRPRSRPRLAETRDQPRPSLPVSVHP
jgi:hypothetical protein